MHAFKHLVKKISQITPAIAVVSVVSILTLGAGVVYADEIPIIKNIPLIADIVDRPAPVKEVTPKQSNFDHDPNNEDDDPNSIVLPDGRDYTIHTDPSSTPSVDVKNNVAEIGECKSVTNGACDPGRTVAYCVEPKAMYTWSDAYTTSQKAALGATVNGFDCFTDQELATYFSGSSNRVCAGDIIVPVAKQQELGLCSYAANGTSQP